MRMVEGKSIIVTGAGSGIGRHTALLLASSGARVTVADISPGGAEETRDLIHREGGSARIQITDVTSEDAVQALIKDTVDAYGPLDGAFNNAGIEMHFKPITELTAAEWARVIEINLTSVFYCLKHQMRAMTAQGRGGSIVNASSGNGIVAQANAAEFIASKFGVVGITKAAAVDGGPNKIRVNAVCPGLIITPALEQKLATSELFQQLSEGLKKRHVIGRFGKPQDVAETVMWLLSNHSEFITGVAMPVDGGYVAQ